MELVLDHHEREAVFFDLETQSFADLKKVGGRRYAADPSTRVLTAVFLIDSVHHVWIPCDLSSGSAPLFGWGNAAMTPAGSRFPVVVHHCLGLPGPVLQAIADDRVFVGHNLTEFDYHVWRHKIHPLPRRWYDTLFTARAAGLPGKLDDLGKRLTGRGKDEGQAILRKIMRQPDRPPKPGYVAVVARYNVMDVELTELVYRLTLGCGEPDVIAMHLAINDRGVGFDMVLGTTIRDLSLQAIERSVDDINRLTGGALANLRSIPQVHAWLRSRGVNLPDLRQNTIDRFLEAPDEFGTADEDGSAPSVDPVVFPVLRLRQAALRITGAKMERALATVDDDGRIRGLLRYHQAHTGRFSSVHVQIHNLPRALKDLKVEQLVGWYDAGQLTYEALQYAVGHIPNATVDDALSSLVRPALVPAAGKALVISDFNAIELRGTAWVAEEGKLLAQFAAGQDVYCEMAGRIYGREVTKEDETERGVGKVTCLGAGYGMGAPTFSLYCAGQGIDLAAANTSAEACIEAFRSTYPRIAGQPAGWFDGKIVRKGGIWREYTDAAMRVVLDRTTVAVGRCQFTRVDDDLVVTLPSGRELFYRQCRVESRVPSYARMLGLVLKPKPTLVYDGPRGESVLFGGKITENLVQAICRDLLCHAMLRCEQEGLLVAFHVHDEIVLEVLRGQADEALHQLVRIMVTPPPWAPNFPIAAEGFASPRYTKGAFNGWPKYKLSSSDCSHDAR
jgi:DNA polymerase bacteriophage-type